MTDIGGQTFKQHGFTGVSWQQRLGKYNGAIFLTAEELSDLPDSLRTGAKRQRLSAGNRVTAKECARGVDKWVGMPTGT
jgi:hypothetical protein